MIDWLIDGHTDEAGGVCGVSAAPLFSTQTQLQSAQLHPRDPSASGRCWEDVCSV